MWKIFPRCLLGNLPNPLRQPLAPGSMSPRLPNSLHKLLHPLALCRRLPCKLLGFHSFRGVFRREFRIPDWPHPQRRRP